MPPLPMEEALDPYLGEVRIFPWPWPPQNWALCNGASLPTQQYQALFALLGKLYGGNGTTSFNLPDLRGRTPVCEGQGFYSNYTQGQSGGEEKVTLTAATMPPHTHAVHVLSSLSGDAAVATSGLPANVGRNAGTQNVTVDIYRSIYPSQPADPVSLSPATLSTTGGGAGHNNMQPYLVMNFCIATKGQFPLRS